ncbi:MAG: nucleotidyltransferase family protein [bacterium]|nr:nucleotidyltransferase family protein [bacterium]
MHKVEKFFIDKKAILEEAIHTIQRGGEGIALVVDSDRRFIGTITDGDVRRAILNKMKLTTSVDHLLTHRPPNYLTPTTASIGASTDELVRIMREKVIRQIPLIDTTGRVVRLALLSEFVVGDASLPLTAVVMAGGKGQRLQPLTEHLPKPMLPLHKQPLMERTIEQLRDAGITKVHITTHYKSEVIVNHFGDGNSLGVAINYITEKLPLGTAGALSLMEKPDKPFLVINGDIVTQLDFRALFDFHREHDAMMTVGVRIYEFQIPYGVVETNDVFITRLVEKPLQTFTVNAGIYLLSPDVHDYIPANTAFHMTDLIARLMKEGKRVVSFPIQEYWLDVGEHADYKKANEDAKNGRL